MHGKEEKKERGKEEKERKRQGEDVDLYKASFLVSPRTVFSYAQWSFSFELKGKLYLE